MILENFNYNHTHDYNHNYNYDPKYDYDNNCNYDPNCNDSIEDSEYQSDPTWIFEYVSSYNINQNHLYQINIPMRPLDGSELLDEDGNTIFPSSDCGRIGITLFKFTVIDQDGLIDQIIDIPLETLE